MSPKAKYKLAYRLVRLREYEHRTYEEWDYAHNPNDEEIYYADLRWSVVEDCRRQRAEIEPQLEGSEMVAAALDHWLKRNDKLPRLNKLAHLANNFGIAPFSNMPWRSDKRDWYIGHFVWRLPTYKKWGARETFLKRAREIHGLLTEDKQR